MKRYFLYLLINFLCIILSMPVSGQESFTDQVINQEVSDLGNPNLGTSTMALVKGTQSPLNFDIITEEKLKLTGAITETVIFTSNSGEITASREVELKPGTYIVEEKDLIYAKSTLFEGTIFSADASFIFTYTAPVQGKYKIDKKVQWHDIKAVANGGGDLTGTVDIAGNIGSKINVLVTVTKDIKAGDPVDVTIKFDGKIDKTTTINLIEATAPRPGLTLPSATPSAIMSNGKDTSLLSVRVRDKSGKGIKKVVVDLTDIGGAAETQMFDDGTHGDATVGDGVYSLNVTAPSAVSSGDKNPRVTATDADGNSTSMTIGLNIIPLPAVIDISSNWGTRGASGLIVTISGQSFADDITTASVVFSDGQGITVTSVAYVSSTEIRATINIDASASIGARYVSVTTGAQTATSDTPIFNVIDVDVIPLDITGISPNKAPQGATLYNVEISGGNFVDGAIVSLSGIGVSVNSVDFVNSGRLRSNLSIAANAPLGKRNLIVTNPGGLSATLNNAFTVEEAAVVGFSISRVEPNSGTQGTAFLPVFINGQGFPPTLRFLANNISLGQGITVNMANYVTPFILVAYIDIASDASPGPRDVSVTIGGETATGFGAFTVAPKLALHGATPNRGNLGAENMPVLLNGLVFKPGAIVGFGAGITVKKATVDSSTQITANISISPKATLGPRHVQVTNPGGEAVSAPVFEVSAVPSITQLTPPWGKRGCSNMDVTISGANFVDGASASFASGGISVHSVGFVDHNTLTANIAIAADATLGFHHVTVTNPGNVSATLPNAFEVKPVAPTISSLEPSSGYQGETKVISILGVNFKDGANVSFSGLGIAIEAITFVSSAEIKVNITIADTATVGARDVTVTNPDKMSDTRVGAAYIKYLPPGIIKVEPDSGIRGAVVDVSVLGVHFRDGADVVFSGTKITTNSTAVISDTEIKVNIAIASDASLGAHDVTVTNDDGASHTKVGALTITSPPPTVAGVSPTSGRQGETINVSILGTHFQDGASVTFNSAAITTNTAATLSDTEVQANITIASDATLGPHDVTVTNPDEGSNTKADAFTVNQAAPVVAEVEVTEVDPASGNRGATMDVAIKGANFQNGASAAISGLGIAVNSIAFVNATEIQLGITILATASLGPRDITVTNPDSGSNTRTGAFTINPTPAITEVNPAAGRQGETVAISISGVDFQDGASVDFSSPGITVNSASFVNATELQANITIASGAPLGGRGVTIINPDGSGATKTEAFTVNQAAPAITEVNPTGGELKETIDVAIKGANFQNGASAAISGFGIAVNSTTFVDSTEMRFNVTILVTASLGPRDITVTNPDGGRDTSAGAFIVKSAPTITAVEPGEGHQGATLGISISGADFQNSAIVDVSGSGIAVNSTNFVNATKLQANITIAPDALVGMRNVTVTNPDEGTVTKTRAFKVIYPVSLAIQDISGSNAIATNMGERLDLRLWLNSPSVAINGASVYLTYDDTVLEIIDQDTVNPGIQPFVRGSFLGGVNIDNDTHGDHPSGNAIPGAQLDYVEIIFGARPAGEGVLASLSFRVIAPPLRGSTTIAFDFSTSNNRSTSVSLSGYGAITPAVIPAVISLPVVTLSGKVELQGRTSHNKRVTFELRNPNNAKALDTRTVSTNSDGSFSVSFLGAHGAYDVTAKTPGFLRSIAEDVILNVGVPVIVTFEPSLLRGGDCRDDNVVDLADFMIFSNAFGSSAGEPKFDPDCDFNGNYAIELADFAILASNFGTPGVPAPALRVRSSEREKSPLPPFSKGGVFAGNADFELQAYGSRDNNDAPGVGSLQKDVNDKDRETIDVKILSKGVENLYGYSFIMSYDQRATTPGLPLQLAQNNDPAQIEGPFLREGGQTLFFVREEEPGKLLIAASLTGDNPGVTGAGTIAQLRFKGLSDKLTDSYIDLQQVSIVDAYGQVTQLPPKRISLNVVSSHKIKPVPNHTRLLQNFPNPFNPETWIPFALAKSAPVTIRIYSANGQLVRTLNLGAKEAGFYYERKSSAYWDGKDAAGERVASGLYFYYLRAGSFSAMRRMVILK